MDTLKRMATTVILETPCMEKMLCVFLPLILILQLGVEGGTTPANYSSSGSSKSPLLGTMSKCFFVHTVIINLG